MKYLPANVRVYSDATHGPGYAVVMADGSKEWYGLAWQATARANGWTPPRETRVHQIGELEEAQL